MERYTRLASQALRSRLFRVLCIGGVGFTAQTIVFELLSVYLHMLVPSTAVLVGGEVGVLLNFYLNNRFSFTDHLPHAAPLLTRLVRFHVVVSGSLFLQWLFVFLTERMTDNLLLIHGAYASGVIVGFVSNYTWYRLWVWRHHTPLI